MNDTMNDNPYNRVEFDPTASQWVVIVMTTPDEHPARGGAALATRSAFDTREDAGRYADSIADCYHAVLAQTHPKVTA